MFYINMCFKIQCSRFKFKFKWSLSCLNRNHVCLKISLYSFVLDIHHLYPFVHVSALNDEVPAVIDHVDCTRSPGRQFWLEQQIYYYFYVLLWHSCLCLALKVSCVSCLNQNTRVDQKVLYEGWSESSIRGLIRKFVEWCYNFYI